MINTFRRLLAFLTVLLLCTTAAPASDVWPPQSVSDGLNYLYRHMTILGSNSVNHVYTSGGLLTNTTAPTTVTIILTTNTLTNAMIRSGFVTTNWIQAQGYITNYIEIDPIWSGVSNQYASTNWVMAQGFITNSSGGSDTLQDVVNRGGIVTSNTVTIDSSNLRTNTLGGYLTILGSRVQEANSTASAFGSHAEGGMTLASGSSSHSEGASTWATNTASHAEGWLTSAYGAGSHAEGNNNLGGGIFANGDGSHAGGYVNTLSETNLALGLGSFAHGRNVQATGDYSVAFGMGTLATGTASYAEGYYSIAGGFASHAQNQSTEARGSYSHSEGYQTLASGRASHAEGNAVGLAKISATGAGSHAGGTTALGVGQSGTITASGLGSFASGIAQGLAETNIASGIASFAYGRNVQAIGHCSMALGREGIASNDYSYVWSDGTVSYGSHGTNSFNINAFGGFWIGDYQIADINGILYSGGNPVITNESSTSENVYGTLAFDTNLVANSAAYTVCDVSLTGDTVLWAPTNAPYNGRKLQFRFTADSTNRTVTFAPEPIIHIPSSSFMTNAPVVTSNTTSVLLLDYRAQTSNWWVESYIEGY